MGDYVDSRGIGRNFTPSQLEHLAQLDRLERHKQFERDHPRPSIDKWAEDAKKWNGEVGE
jgi:hypothetical protein